GKEEEKNTEWKCGFCQWKWSHTESDRERRKTRYSAKSVRHGITNIAYPNNPSIIQIAPLIVRYTCFPTIEVKSGIHRFSPMSSYIGHNVQILKTNRKKTAHKSPT
ncbi:hypothetical protein L9F63_022100, partial [Diploptera punctata]